MLYHFIGLRMVVASDSAWRIPDLRSDDVCSHKKSPFCINELEIVERSFVNCNLTNERRKKPISKIFRDVVYRPSLEDIKEVDGEELAEVEDKFDLTLSSLHRERALNSGCFTPNEDRKYRKKKYKKSQPSVDRRPRSQTL